MAKIGQPYTSGRWVVQDGKVDEFVRTWSEFVEWSSDNAPGAQSFHLIQEDGDPRRFVSFGAWEHRAAVDAWRATEEFGQRLGRCRALCEDFQATDHTLVAAVGS